MVCPGLCAMVETNVNTFVCKKETITRAPHECLLLDHRVGNCDALKNTFSKIQSCLCWARPKLEVLSLLMLNLLMQQGDYNPCSPRRVLVFCVFQSPFTDSIMPSGCIGSLTIPMVFPSKACPPPTDFLWGAWDEVVGH